MCAPWLGLVFWSVAGAQQREPAFEVYGLTGGYFHANVSINHAWKPQYGAGILAPLSRNWAVLFDVTTSSLGIDMQGFGGEFARERRVVLMPSVVRLWRRDRFSIYAGGGLGFEHERQHTRFRAPIGYDANGRPLAVGDLQDFRSTRTDTTLLLRVGTTVSLTRSVVLRSGYSWFPRYIDERPSMSAEFGFGYRF